jgi:hypothetical protein
MIRKEYRGSEIPLDALEVIHVFITRLFNTITLMREAKGSLKVP